MTPEPLPMAGEVVRRFVRVRGGVQGVGFRPFVHQLARRHGLAGHVGNDEAGVFLELEGSAAAIDECLRSMRTEAPLLARIEAVEVAARAATGIPGFAIVSSEASPGAVTPVSPDAATCTDCLHELFDPTDRRFRYPFINCTNCGPRYTIVTDVPYDRPNTTMEAFAMCEHCRTEYEDPANRRFHAQPNACPACGPRLAWVSHAGPGSSVVTGDAALVRALERLAAGGIVAVKGIGGFHLACEATSDEALSTLRSRKARTHKPFAVMAPNVDAVRSFAHVNDAERRLLQSRERPIVVLRRRERFLLSAEIAPGLDTIGVMLPYAPLHHLLMAAGLLVLTSGNLGDEPIARENEEALDRLSLLADGFLLHDRGIRVTNDDSVVRVFRGRELPLRRSRGYAPYPIALPREVSPVLAVGAELKATACVARGAYGFLSPHVGDLGGVEAMDAMERTCEHLARLFRVEPSCIACDMHPGYLSARWARAYASRRGIPIVTVQHHHAHVAALMAEHGLDGTSPILGFAFDGTGYGTDGSIWGGEALVADYERFTRVAHLALTPLPGGDAGVRRPARIALAQLWSAGIPWHEELFPVTATTEEERRVLRRQLEQNLHCVATSSMGRFLDAAAAICGGRQETTYEGQAAIEFEALAAQAAGDGDGAYAFGRPESDGSAATFDGAPVLEAVIEDLRAGTARALVAWRVHAAVADEVVRLSRAVRESHGVETVGLTGGVFQNVLLLQLASAALAGAGFSVLTHQLVPSNDGGIALGQAMVAGLRARPEA